jgi:uncharacterized protein (TIGR02391 family)
MMELDNKIPLEFSEEDLRFLTWAMDFLKGGPFDRETDKQREETAFKVKKALTDFEKGIIRSVDSGVLYITCAFCEGGGCFPDILPGDDIETEPCPVCKGKGHNVFRATSENISKCRFCGGDGKAWNSSGYATGEACPVCHGTGIILFDQLPENSENESFWNLINPTITQVSKSRFDSGHYADSVEAAFKEVNKAIKEIVKADTGEELDGAPLMYKAFSPNQPIICVGDLSSETGRNIQQGYMQMYAGAMIGIRNPKAHENIVIDSTRAIHLLTLASLLMSKLDERV